MTHLLAGDDFQAPGADLFVFAPLWEGAPE